MKVRVWAYQDGTLLPDGFEAELVGNESVAMVPCLIALLEGLGIEVCVGDDEEEENFNQDVVDWNDVTETGPTESEGERTRRYFDESCDGAKEVAIDQAHDEALGSITPTSALPGFGPINRDPW